MDLEEYTRKRLEKSAAEAKLFWDGVKNRFSKKPLSSEETFQIIDIQDISDDCIDFIMLRKNEEANINQLEHCRITAKKRLFKKPKLSMYFTSGPFEEDFFGES